MTLIGLELSDAGIMAADSTTGKLLQVDGQATESPGFALPGKSGLLVGQAAASKAHLFPRQIINHFWDHLDTDPLSQSGRQGPQSTAEIAYQHLNLIWQHIQKPAAKSLSPYRDSSAGSNWGSFWALPTNCPSLLKASCHWRWPLHPAPIPGKCYCTLIFTCTGLK